MTPKFINQYEVTSDLYREWAGHPVGKKAVKNRKRSILLRTVTAICSIFILVIGFQLKEWIFVYLGFVLLAFALFRLFILPEKAAKNQFNLVLKSLNSEVWINKFTFADEILYEYGNTKAHYSYSDMIDFSEDSGYFYLFFHEDMLLRIRKDSFIAGTADEFRKFWKSILSARESGPQET